jgi:arginase
LTEQTAAMVADLPGRPLVLGGCCCAHVGAVEGLSRDEGVLAVVWIDAHGDLNTPASSPSGNTWGMPLRMLIDNGAVAAGNVALVGARALDPPEAEFIERSGVHTGADAIEQALADADAVYVAVDCDSLEPGELDVFMPEPGGLSLAQLEDVLRDVAARRRIAGAGLTGLVGTRENEAKLTRLCSALGL